MTRRIVTTLSVLAVAGLALAGCATGAGSGTTGGGSATPEPTGSSSAPIATDVAATWLDGGRMIGVVTQGSSSCVPTASDAQVEDGTLVVTLADLPADTVCTADFAPRVTIVALPEGIDPSQPLPITLAGAYTGEGELAGVEGLSPSGGETDYAPSAGWVDTAGQFALLTWGSSGCPPLLDTVTASAPGEVSVTFQTPPADRMCTMDMAPRGTLAMVDGLEMVDGPATAVLSGDGFDDVRVPIVG